MSAPDPVAWLNGCYDRAEQRARAVARSVGEHHYAPVEAPQYDDTSARWTARRWLYAKKVSAEDGRQWWRDEGPKVTDDVWPEVADHIADHDPAWRLADIVRKRKILAIHRTEPDDDKRHWRMPVRACVGCGWDQYEEAAVEDINGCPVVRLLAEEFTDEPGYRGEWRP